MLQRGPFAGIADAAAAVARGNLDAQRLLAHLRSGEAADDATLRAIRDVGARGEPHRLAGFARTLQKALLEAAR